LQSRFPSQAGGSADIVFKAAAGVNDPSARARLDDLFAQVARIPQVAEVVSPMPPAAPASSVPMEPSATPR
jgi:hypothetical protein